MAKKFANILGISNVFMYSSETNTYRTDLLVDEVKNEIDYNTICFVKANSSDTNRKISNHTIKENDTFIISQKEVFAINPKDGFTTNITAGTNISITNGAISANGYTYNSSNYSFAEGVSTTAQGKGSHAEGSNTSSVGDYSHAEGVNSESSGHNSHAEGNGSKSIGQNSHAEGTRTIANNNQSHSEGFETKAMANGAHAEGDSTIAYGKYSHTEGANSVTGYDYKGDKPTANDLELPNNEDDDNGGYAHAEGSSTLAMGKAAHSEGNKTFAAGDYSHAEGAYTTAEGYASHAEGGNTIAKGVYSHAEGKGTMATNEAEHAEGKYNVSSTGTISSIGIGTNDTDRKNAFEVMQNGDIYIKGIGGYDGTNASSATNVQQVILDLNSLITNLKTTLVENGVINENPSVNVPDLEIPEIDNPIEGIDYSTFFEGKNVNDADIYEKLGAEDIQVLRIESINVDDTNSFSTGNVNIDIQFASPVSNYENFNSIMFTNSTNDIICFRDINSRSLNNNTYTFNINWNSASNGNLKLSSGNICILFPKTLQQYAIETPEKETPGILDK